MNYTELLYHAVILPYGSECTLPTDNRRIFLYQEVWEIIQNMGGHLYRINAMSDHAHLLFTIPPTIALSDCMQAIKNSTSTMIQTINGFERFKTWSDSYAALSCNLFDKDVIMNYITNQQEHHKTVTFKDEYMSFIKEMGLEFNESDWNG